MFRFIDIFNNIKIDGQKKVLMLLTYRSAELVETRKKHYQINKKINNKVKFYN